MKRWLPPDCLDACDAQACEPCFLQDELAPGCDTASCDGAQPCINPHACGPGEFCQTGCCRPI